MTAQDWRSLMSIASQVSEEEKRRLLLDGIYSVVQNWQGPLPDFLEIYRPEKIECLLSYAVTDQKGDEEARIRFIKFVVDTGYRDQPKVGTDGRYVLHRTTPIHLVLRAKINNWDAIGMNMVHFLFEIYNRFDLNYIDETGLTHFQAACSIFNGHQLVVKFLEHGQNPNFFIKGYSLLRSALHNDTKWAAELLRRGADPTWVDADGSTALHIICRNGCVDLLQLFFEIVDNHKKPVWVNARDSFGDTPLHLALESGNVRTSEILLKRGADVNLANKEGSTPLHTICRKTDNNGLIEAFFRINDENHQTVQVNVRNSLGNTPLHLALESGNVRTYEILLKRGADPNLANAQGSTPLHIICRRTEGHKLVKIFFNIVDDIGKPVRVNVPDKKGNTPLHLAISHRSMRKSEILLVNGANPNLADKDGCTALHLICNTRPYIEMRQFFKIIDKNQQTVQIDARNKDGETPLHMALRSRNNKKIQMLLKRGADPNVANQDGWTALHFLSQRTSDDFMCHFLNIIGDMQQPVEIDARDTTGRTPLSLALLNANSKQAEELLRKGADPNSTDNQGWTPLHIMCIKCNWFLEMFFRINAERQQPVEINAKTYEGTTPLNLLRNCKPMNYKEASRYLEQLGAELD